ncbi:hypothetical protein EW145_g4615 [Phellinidium pouzarii]|uniref:Ricin B lectin domain-containing protein n=1 Tax=Phellinidium pouzarii TaxID=167371 RepID=A0A4S4L4Q7_9AGAM|nr:hypothetical protein EW145_g4615 [Phellinidium pouzarii]
MPSSHLPLISKAGYWIRNRDSKSVLSIGSTNSNGNVSLVCQDKYSNAQSFKDDSQMWLLELLTSSGGACVYIRNARSNHVLDAEGWGIEEDAQVIIYPKKVPSGNNQHWIIERVDNDSNKTWCRIVNVCTGKVLEETAQIGQPILSSTWNNRHNQHWFFEPVDLPPAYCITHTSTGRCLQYDAKNGATAGRVQSRGDAKISQLWFLETLGDANVIRNVENERMVLDLYSHNKADGTPVVTYRYNGGRNQQWKRIKIDHNDSNNARFLIVSVEANTVIQLNEGQQMLQAQTRKDDASQSWQFEKYPSSLSRKLGDNISHSGFGVNEVIRAIDEDVPSPIVIRSDVGSSDNRDAFSMVEVAFKNTGEHIITLNAYDASDYPLQNMQDIQVVNGHVRIMNFRVNETYNFILKCGRRIKYFREYGTVLDIGSRNSSGNIPLVGQDKHANPRSYEARSQMWSVEKLPSTSGDERFYIRNAQSGNVLDMEGGGIASATPVVVYRKVESDD